MRISLEVYDFAGGLRAMAHFLLRSEKPHIFGLVRAVVDTGSPTTIIGTGDIKRMRISKLQFRDLESRKKSISYGGEEVKTKIISDATLKFGNKEMKMPVEVVVEGEREDTQLSVLGVDCMKKTNASFFFKPNKKEAYFYLDELQPFYLIHKCLFALTF